MNDNINSDPNLTTIDDLRRQVERADERARDYKSQAENLETVNEAMQKRIIDLELRTKQMERSHLMHQSTVRVLAGQLSQLIDEKTGIEKSAQCFLPLHGKAVEFREGSKS